MLPPKWSSFRNPNDALCASCIWMLLLLVFFAYVSFCLASFSTELQRPTKESVYNERLQMPLVRLDVCELTAFHRQLNYSLLDHLLMERELEFLLPNGTEIWRRDVLNRSDMEFVHVDAMSCLQVPSMQVVPQGPIHPKLQRQNYSYVSGLFIRPSLANASHPVSIRQESFLKVLTPFTAKNRTAILRAVVSLDRWSDSLGGRLGAPYADTFYLDDSRIVPEAAEETTPVDVMPQLGNRLKIVLPMPTSMVRVHHHLNDIVDDILTLLGNLASGIFIFGLLTMIFPAIREEKYHFFLHLERFGLGNPSELNPLLAKPTV